MIRMSLRLLLNLQRLKRKIADYVNSNFVEAKEALTTDQKTTLANNSINNAGNLIQLLQSGAHNYANSANFEQTVAMSIIIDVLDITHQNTMKVKLTKNIWFSSPLRYPGGKHVLPTNYLRQ